MLDAMVVRTPDRVTEIDLIRCRQGARGRARDATDDGARASVAAERADSRAGAGAEQTAGDGAVRGGRSACREQHAGDENPCEGCFEISHGVPSVCAGVRRMNAVIVHIVRVRR